MESSNNEPEIISQTEFAKRVGVNRSSVRAAITAGRLSKACIVETPRGPRLRFKLAMTEWSGLREDDAPNWRIKKLEQDAKLAERRRLDMEREARVAEGELCHIEDVEAVWIDRVARTRSLLLAVAPAAARPIAAMAKKDMSAAELSNIVKAEIEKRIRECLSELSNDPKQMLKQVVKKRKK